MVVFEYYADVANAPPIIGYEYGVTVAVIHLFLKCANLVCYSLYTQVDGVN